MKISGVKKISIIGLGMMGSSLAASLKRNGFSGIISGYARSQAICDEALEKKFLDKASTNILEMIKESDLIVMCLPIKLIIKKTNDILKHLKPGAIVTDVGSTKLDIMNQLKDKFDHSDCFFVGSHPICGSEKKGFFSADPDLYLNQNIIICSEENTPAFILEKVTDLWSGIGSNTLIMQASEHDELLAATSHLPHIIAVMLVNIIRHNDNELSKLIDLCGTGFIDTSRLASGSAAIWTDIISTNENAILKQLDYLDDQINDLSNFIKNKKYDEIYNWLINAANTRTEILSNIKNK